MSAVDAAVLQGWVGRTRLCHDVISPAPLAALSATLDHASSLASRGDALPACWHWLFFQDAVPASALDVDGHAQRGEFLPPVLLPRRMWAGGRLRFLMPLYVGDAVSRRSEVSAITHKHGRSGELVFVTVRHAIYRGEHLALEEEQDLVYREQGRASGTASGNSAMPLAQWSREVLPDPVLLFRYSALTFNSHRIHYDRDYAMREEGYTSLVVQAPLSVTLLLDLLWREVPRAAVAELDFRALGPVLEGAPMQLKGRQDGRAVRLWALDAEGKLAMDVRARLRGD